MDEQFNPYLKWLGIPRKHQPPHYYHLLGIGVFEDDPDVIENAADRQMAFLRNFRTSSRAEAAERLLNEIAQAKLCLLDPQKKAAYDAHLRARQQPTDPQTPKPVPVAGVAPASKRPISRSGEQAHEGFAVRSARSRSVRRRKSGPSPLAIGSIIVGIAAVLVLVMALRGTRSPTSDSANKSPAVARNAPLKGQPASPQGSIPSDSGARDNPLSDKPPTTAPEKLAAQESQTFDSVDDPAAANEREPASTNTTEPANGASIPSPNDAAPNDAAPNDVPSVDKPGVGGTPLTEKTSPDAPDSSIRPSTNEPEPTDGTNDDSSGPRVHPVPTGEEQLTIEQRIRDLYDVAERLTRAEQTALAERLIADGKAAGDNRNDQFVMLRFAAEQAAAAGDLAAATGAVDFLEAVFDIDAPALRLKLVESAGAAAVPADEKLEILLLGLDVIDASMEANRYAEAEQTAILLINAARRLNDRELNQQLIERRKSAILLRGLHEKAKAAFAQLEQSPDDPPANTVVGSFWCFIKGNWEQGLPHLAKGDDAALAEIAQQELARPVAAQDQIGLADAWFARGKKERPPVSLALLERAVHWYEKARDEATGLTRTAIDANLKSIEKMLAAHRPKKATREATIYAAADSSFDMLLNGEPLMSGGRSEVEQAKRELKPGDVILVRGSNRRGEKGFACVIKFDGDDRTLATGESPAWQLFLPANPFNWTSAAGMVRVFPPQPADGSPHDSIRSETGLDCKSIWSQNPYRAYFVLRVP